MEKSLNNSQLVMYGASWCSHCVTLAKKLNDRGAAYDYRDVDDSAIRSEMNQKTDGNQTIPVLCNGNECWVNPDENILKGVLDA